MSEWRQVVGWEGRYEVSADGRIRTTTGTIIGQWLNDQGYALVRLSSPRRMVRAHRVVALAWVPNREGAESINHINNDRADNRAANLEWCSQQENLAHARRQGRMHRYPKGNRPLIAKLSTEQVMAIRSAYANGEGSWQALATRFGVSKRCIGHCIRRETYADV